MEVSATVIPGCVISATNINFGDITVNNSNKSTVHEVSAPLNIRCSKGATVEITGSDTNNPEFLYGPRLWKVGETTDKRDTRIRYGVQLDNVVSTSQITILKAARYNFLWNTAGDHNFRFRLNTSEQVSIPVIGRFLDHVGATLDSPASEPLDLFSIQSGNYTDDYTYTLTF